MERPVDADNQGTDSLVNDGRPVRIIIADSDTRVRHAIAMFLRQEPGPLAIVEASDVDGLTDQIRQHDPDIVLLEWSLPAPPATPALFVFRDLRHRSRVIVLDSPSAKCRRAEAVGADSVVGKDEPPENLLNAFRRLRAELGTSGTQ